MKLFKKLKKGFTLIELVVVIAVIAILSAVSVVSYVSITNKAHQSNDKLLIDQVNLALAGEEVSDGKQPTMHQMLEGLAEDGFVAEKLKAESKNYEFAYSMKDNRFVILEKDGKVAYPSEFTNLSKDANIWRFANNSSNLKDGFSYYLTDDFAETTLEASAGIDVGKHSTIKEIKYIKNNNAQDVVIRTNGGTLIVDSAVDHVEHYGVANIVDVIKVSPSTYVEHGTVGKMTISSEVSNVVLESTAIVVEIANQGSNNLTNNASFVGKINNVPTENEIVKVYDYEQLYGLAMYTSASKENNFINGKTISIEKDIDCSKKEWIPFGNDYDNSYWGTINGNNHKIIGLTNKYTTEDKLNMYEPGSSKTSGLIFGFIAFACGQDNTSLTIKNLTFVQTDIELSNGKNVGCIVGLIGNTGVHVGTKGECNAAQNICASFENTTVEGTVSGLDKVGGFVGATSQAGDTGILESLANGHKIEFKNCVNKANINATGGSKRAGAFIGQFGDGKTNSEHTNSNGEKLTFNSCTNTGNIQCGYSGDGAKAANGFVGHNNKGTIN